MKVSTAIRIILSLLLIYGAYTETGKWTALNLLLTLAGIEILVVYVKKLNRQVNPIDFLFKLKRRKEENST